MTPPHGPGTRLPTVEATAARRGQWCPKLCSHACPVLAATGRSDAVPWSFHRTLADLADGRTDPADAADRLVACTGCRSCLGGCDVEGQDVPAQVRAGRAAVVAAGAASPAVDAAVGAVDVGDSPYGVERPRDVAATHADLVLVAGCRDEPGLVAAAVRVLGAAGEAAHVVVPTGCCGGTLRDLGAVDAADRARDRLAGRLDDDVPVVLLDPHCREEVVGVVDAARVVDLVVHLRALQQAGRLPLESPAGSVRWHEPCALRTGPASGVGRDVLAATGALVELPGEVHGGCSGGGMGLPLLAPDTAVDVARHRLVRFSSTGPVVTACAGAVASLHEADGHVVHLVHLLASLLGDHPESVA